MSETESLFDTHCHLYSGDLQGDTEGVLARARQSGVRQFLVPGIDLTSSRTAAGLAAKYDGVWAAAGIQPTNVSGCGDEVLGELKMLLLEPGVIAVGETGLDCHHDHTTLPAQIEWLHLHTVLAESLGYPLILHSRSAEDTLLEELPVDLDVPVILHCYTGSPGIALKAADRGYYMGFAGPLTYKRNDELRELVRLLPADRILAETDSPWLSPEPFRGSGNEPARVGLVADAVASARGLSRVEARSLLWRNSLDALLLAPGCRRTDLLYRLGNSLYANITGKCNCDCIFCLRFRQDGVGGYYLKHREEPSSDRLKACFELLEPGWFDELVFCGFGEPTQRGDLLMELALIARRKGYSTRLDTNGLALELMHERKVRKLLGCFDRVSVSLNESSAVGYGKICRTGYQDPWNSLLRFISLSNRTGCQTTLTAVRYPGVDLAGAENLAEELGLPFRIRG